MKRRLIALGLAVTMLCTTWIQSGMQACAAEASYATESQNELQSTGYEQNVQGEYNPETTDVYEETSGEYSVVEEESETVSVTTEEVDESEPTTETENVTESEESDETIEETVSGDVEDETTETTTEDMHAVESPLTPMPQRIELNQSQISLYEATTGLAGDTYTLSASVYPENWYRRDYYIEWKIYNADGTSPCTIAKLTEEPGGEETGLLRGLDTVNVVSKSLGGAEEAGKAIVTATIYASEDISQTPIVKASCKVTVLPSEAAEDAEEIIDGIWMTGFKESDDAFVYSGAKITQNVSLYDRKMKLTEGKDYTLTYKNNINACDSKQLNSPSMTITMKGKYSGTKVKFFEIKQRDISEAVVEQKDTAYNTNGKMQKYVPTVKYNGKKLTNNKDFKVTYHVIQNGSNPKTFLADEPDNTWINNHKYETVEVFYLLEGQGNFTGKNLLQQRYSDADVISAQMENLEFTGSYLIVPKSNNIANATIKYKSKLSYCGASITPADLDISIKMSGEGYYEDLMDPGPWKITFCDSKGNPIDSNSINAPGSYSFTIEGADLDEYPYAIGKVTKKFTVSAGYQLKNVAKVKAGWQDTIPFNKAVSATIDETTGKAKGMRQIIDDSDCDLLESIDGSIPISTDDYDVVYSNNTKVGTAKITFKGKGKCTGTFTKTYKICGGDFEVYFAPGETVTIGGKAETTYVQGGVSPKVIVAAEDGNELVNKKDYTITYVNNKAVTDEAHVRIKGMGNYVNTERELTYAIKPASIATCTVTVADKAASTKTNDYISPVTVYAPNGKKLVAGKDYQKLTIDDYSFDRKTGSDTPEAGTEITVTITGIGCDKQAPMTYTGTGNFYGQMTASYHIYDKRKSVSTLQIVVDATHYTGEPLEPALYDATTDNPTGDIHVYATAADKKNGIEIAHPGDIVEVVAGSYTNNVKVGTGKFTLHGKGEYGGTKVVSFKIWDTKLSASLDARAEYPSVIYSGDSQIADVTFVQGGVTPTLTVKAGDTTLELKKDYTVTYSNNKAVSTATKTAIATVKGKGKYAKCEPLNIPFNIVPDSISLSSGYKVTVADKAASTKTNDYISPVTVYAPNGKKLVAGKDYQKLTIDDYSFDGKTGSDTPEAGTEITVTITGIGCDKQAPMTYTGTGNFYGQMTASYHIYDKRKSVSTLQIVVDAAHYTGEPLEPALYDATTDNPTGDIHVYATAADKKNGIEIAHPGDIVEVVAGSYTNNVKVGTGKFTLHGKGEYGGTKVVSFKIWDTKLSASLDARAEYPSVIYSGDSQVADVTFVQGGVTPTLTVKANGNTLELKKDYTITYSNNKAVSTATKTAIATVKGKGKYAKSEPLQIPFNIVQDSIAGYKVVVADKTFSNKVNDYMSAPTVYDPNGKKLTAGRDYEKLTLDNYDYDGKTGVNDKPNTTTTVNVKIIGKGNYKDTAVGYYKLYDKSKAVSNFQVVIDDQTYTGQAVEPKLVSNKDAKGIHVYLTANDKKAKNDNASQFVTVVSYSNNINIGTAKVTLRGKGNYGGTKTVSYKIVKKQLKSIRVDKVVIKDKKNITKFYKGQGDASRKELIAYACPSDAENDTIVWTTSNKAVVRINKQWQVPVTDPSNVTGINEYHVEIESVGDGLVTIKAVSQDSGKADSISVDTRKKKTTGLSLSKSEVTLNAGESTTLSCAYTPSDAYIEDIVTSTSNFTVANAEVNISGNKINVTINARHGGVAYVMVTDKNSGASASCMVTVNEKYVEGNMIKVEGLQSGSSESAGNNNIRCFTNAFNKAKNQKPDERQSIYVPAGTYYITTRNSASTNGIQVCNLNNVSIVMDSGTVIKGIPCGENSSRVMWINECNGVSITGGTIIGDLGSHSGAGEQSHGIVAVQSSNICLRNMTVKSCAGDSLIITNNNNRNSGCSNIDVIGCTLGQSGRHCVSLTASKNINFKNCSIETGNAHGCIDIEANSGYSNEHIIFDGCTIRVGGGASIAIINSANDIRIINSRVSGGYIENRSGSNVFYNGVNIPTGDTWDP